MLMISAQPQTVEDVQSEIVKWLGPSTEELEEPPCTFSITEKESGLKIFISSAWHEDLKVQLVDRCLQMELKQKKLSLDLASFRVWTELAADRLCFKIYLDPNLNHWLVESLLKDFRETKHPAFCARMLRVVAELDEDLPSNLIEEVTSAPTDQLVLLEALSSVEWVKELTAQNPILEAKLRGLELRQEILQKAGGVLTSEEVADLLGVSRQAVDKRRSANQLLALTQGRRGYQYPGFQFEDGKALAGLDKVLANLEALDPWMQLRFFTSPNERLSGRTPLEVLRKGRIDDVVQVASGFGEQGAL